MSIRWMTAGESHGPGLVAIIEGIPAGLEISRKEIDRELSRRQKGLGRSKRQEIENDHVEILAGIRHGKTIGSPVALIIRNRDHENWRDEMSVDASAGEGEEQTKSLPRPGHAGLAGMLKWGLDDSRNVTERASGRTTAATVAIGAICKRYLAEFRTFIGHRLVAYGSEWLVEEDQMPPTRAEIGDDPWVILNWSELDGKRKQTLEELIESARQEGETLGGTVQIIAANVVPGLGSMSLPDMRLDARIAGAVMGVPGVKAVEIGSGVDQSYMTGREAHDLFARSEIPSFEPWYGRTSNLAGGIEGGISNGEPVCVTAWLKPLATVNPPNMSIDVTKKEAVMPESTERSDVSAVEPTAVVIEAVVALELVKAHREKFGGDTMVEVREAVGMYEQRLVE